MKKINYIILGFVGLALVLTAGLVVAEKPRAKELSRAVLKIDSLSCGGCFSTINAGLAPLEGYSGMGANLFRKLIAIDFIPPLTAEKISQALIDAGYPGKLETVDSISKEESFAYLESKRTGFISGGSSCGGGYAGRSNGNQGSSGKAPSPSGSCCPLPGGSQPTQDL
ncbi:MAG: heavy-metal-associated domain-containing protein [Deltaproteobacteria bacterium]|uniref:heavy-metal-associated domain-containing protein n=1 Tax=Desulfobacula sp. TaxID=2593537 RepID=UPI0019B537D9|nr:heavy-metal-associated domain-containing protein [Candidatus Desulfobacula maris]MBL6994433.1 heavy-metal-associated domain-containing protein [Desulfobacula sp.]